MVKDENIQIVYKELEAGAAFEKCHKCGCMRETLDNLAAVLPGIHAVETDMLAQQLVVWTRQMLPAQYTCLGCAHCYPAVAQNAFAAAFPNVDQAPLACDFQVHADKWPAVPGEYYVVNPHAHVAVTTLGSIALAAELAERKPHGLAIAGKTETENIGVDKVVKNIVTNPSLQFLVVAGSDPAGHQSGLTLLALAANGVDANGRVIGSPGKRPVLRNVSLAEVNAFRAQVQVVNLIGCEDAAEIMTKVETLAPKEAEPCG
jgi:tetrahydromethanopterin S-methyltransferase subunit A